MGHTSENMFLKETVLVWMWLKMIHHWTMVGLVEFFNPLKEMVAGVLSYLLQIVTTQLVAQVEKCR